MKQTITLEVGKWFKFFLPHNTLISDYNAGIVKSGVALTSTFS